MALRIVTLLNHPIDSNSFIVYEEGSGRCLIIDPGAKDPGEINAFLEVHRLRPDYIIVTHEHFDHIWGVDYLRARYACPLIASRLCSSLITNPKKNLSLFYDQVGFSIAAAEKYIEELGYELAWGSYKLRFYATPGHSDASVTITLDHYLFTGDTIILGEKTVTKLPGGNKELLKDSVRLIASLTNEQTILYGGHGPHFSSKQIDINKILGANT